MTSAKKVTTAGGVLVKKINDETHVLLVKKNEHALFFPKGHVEAGETIEQAAIREVAEETGLSELRILEKLGVVTRPSTEKSGEHVTKDIHLFLMVTTGSHHGDADEEFAWFSIADGIEKMFFDAERQFLQELARRKGW